LTRGVGRFTGRRYRPCVLALTTLLPLSMGCLEPFAEDRHDLAGLRIVGMRWDGGPEAFVWDGEQAWSASAPEREWTVQYLDECVAEPCDPIGGAFALSVRQGGEHEKGELEIDANAVLEVEPSVSVRVDDEGVAQVAVDRAPEGSVTHFMAPGGEFAEIDAHSTLYTAPGEGIWPVVALTVDGHGGNTWMTVDVVVGEVGSTVAIANRSIPIDTAFAGGGDVVATIEPADTMTGFRLVDLAADGEQEVDQPCGTEEGYWSVDSLVERQCGRDEVAGARVRVHATASP
jgi:hypothetical protein